MEGVGFADVVWWLVNIDQNIGNMASTLFWKDPWLDGILLKVRFSRLFDLANNKFVSFVQMNELR